MWVFENWFRDLSIFYCLISKFHYYTYWKRSFYLFRITRKNSYSSAFRSKNREIRLVFSSVLSGILLILESVPRRFADSREKLQTDQQESQ